jgi:hypothetical protein
MSIVETFAMTLLIRAAFLASICACGTGCGAEDADSASLSWQGAEPHVIVKGHLNGEDLDLSITGEAAADPANVWCAREYAGPPDANGEPDVSLAKLYKVNVFALVTVGGEERRLELEFKPHDFQSDAVPSTARVIPRVDDEVVDSDATWLDFEWHTPDGEGDLLETSAQTGRFELELYSGEPGADGLLIPAGEGSFGGTLDARWSEQERLEASVSAPCMESELDLE